MVSGSHDPAAGPGRGSSDTALHPEIGRFSASRQGEKSPAAKTKSSRVRIFSLSYGGGCRSPAALTSRALAGGGLAVWGGGSDGSKHPMAQGFPGPSIYSGGCSTRRVGAAIAAGMGIAGVRAQQRRAGGGRAAIAAGHRRAGPGYPYLAAVSRITGENSNQDEWGVVVRMSREESSGRLGYRDSDDSETATRMGKGP